MQITQSFAVADISVQLAGNPVLTMQAPLLSLILWIMVL